MTELEQKEMFDKNYPLVWYCYKHLYKDEFITMSKDDLIQEGCLILWKCILKFDYSFNLTPFAYFYPSIMNSMLNWIRVNREYFYYCCAYQKYEDDGVEYDVLDLIPDDTAYIDTVYQEVEDILNKYKRWLSINRGSLNTKTVERKLFNAHMILNELVCKEHVTTRYIEEELNIGRQTVSNTMKELRQAIQQFK